MILEAFLGLLLFYASKKPICEQSSHIYVDVSQTLLGLGGPKPTFSLLERMGNQNK